VFNGAAAVYLSYIGYDAVSTMAEEVKEPVKDIPIGVSGSVIIVTILYCLMAASMCMLLPYDMVIAICLFYSFVELLNTYSGHLATDVKLL
jgi:amino acid transporter